MIDQNAINRILSPILQKGFRVRLKAAMTIRQLLEDECNLSSAFVEREISTVFLNGKAVDNIDKAMVTDKCELALSGPMPGFVGAAMRRGGYYSSMRSAISYTEEGFAPGSEGGTVTVKLYNTLINALGLNFVSRGILISEPDAMELSKTKLGPFIKSTVADQLPDTILVKLELES